MAERFVDSRYMSICSEKTLQTNEKGFFMTFADCVAEKAGENWIENVFGKLTSDSERIRIIYKNDQIKDVIVGVLSNVQEIYRKKSAEISQARRLDAEKLLEKDDPQKALVFFSQSVLRAPVSENNKKLDCDLSLSLALYGRSLCLMKLNEYSLALSDLQFSLKEGLTNFSKAEAFRRMGICYKAVGLENKAKVAFSLAEKLFTEKSQIDSLENDKNNVYVENKRDYKRVEPSLTGSPSKTYKNASNKMAVKDSQTMGRFAVAHDNIVTGETLVVESPYAACLLPDMSGTHCHHCFDRLISPVGCTNCSNVAFCKLECRDAAKYHKYECKVLDLLIGSGMSILAHTALRMITQNSLEEIMEIYRNRSKEPVYSLCTNANMRPAKDFLQRTLMASFLLRCLKINGYFGTENVQSVMPTEDELFVGELLLYNLQMLQFNAHEIYETRHTKIHRFRESKISYIGVAVYPTVSLFNHDCYPAVSRCSNKKCIYYFTLPVSTTELKCPKCGKQVSLKSNIEMLKWCENQYELGIKAMDEQNPERAIPVLCTAIDMFHRISNAPHRETHLAQEALRICMADSGNTSQTLIKNK